MSDPRHAGLRGTHTAAGFVLDAPTVGEAEARRRVLAHWAAGASLRALADGRWLLLLDAPVTVRAEHAPGLPVVARDGALLAAGARPADARPGELVEVRHGRLERHHLAALERIDPSAWVAVDRHTLIDVVALDAVPTAAVVGRLEVAEAPDLRAGARIGEPSGTARRLLQPAEPGRAAPPRGRAGVAPPRGRGRLARLLLRTPAAGIVGRRHARYLERLTRSFERGDYENALRDAIGLGGGGGGDWLTLRLPSRRQGALRPSARIGAGGAVPWGRDALTHLSELYRRAAERLEREGQIERAAFVHADLLHAPRDAVALLERHGKLELAARLAEGRELDADLVVRLWWQAGDRARAVAVARARGAWAVAVEHLERVDAALALELRAEWVAAERGRGDHRGAVDAAWPAPSLRNGIGEDLAALRALGGVQAAAGLGLEIAWRADGRRAAEALALLATADDELASQRLALLEVLAEHRASDATVDRRLAGQGVRALLRDGAAQHPRTVRGGRPLFKHLRGRADPLLRADLPTFAAPSEPLELVVIEGPADRGAVPVSDAVCLAAGVLVAAGERGLLLLSRAGRVLAHWDVVAHQLVVADHGGAVLVGGRGEAVVELHRLDVASRRLSRWTALSERGLLGSFDGGILTTYGHESIEGVDTAAEPPRTLWSELDAGTFVMNLARSAAWMSAIVDAPLQGRSVERSLERWKWELPSRRLRSRDVDSDEWATADARTTADGTILWLESDDVGIVERRRTADGRNHQAQWGGDCDIAVSGEHSALVSTGDAGRLVALRSPPHQERVAVVSFASAEAGGFRVHDEIATVWTADGRIVCVDLVTRECLVNVRTRA